MKLNHDLCNAAFNELSIDLKRNIIAMVDELSSAEAKHPNGVWGGKKVDFIHAAAVVSEEAGELVQAALQHKYEKGQYYKMHKEALQTGASCLRFLMNAPELPHNEKGGYNG